MKSFSNFIQLIYLQDKEASSVYDLDIDDRFAEVDDTIFLNMGFPSKLNAWAGPDHWKFRKVRGKPLLVSYRPLIIP